MDIPKYNGTMHPEEWIRQIKASCYCSSNIINDFVHAYLCKQLIHPAIKIPSINSIETTNALLNALKAHVSFTIFKESCKRKLLTLKYIPEKNGGNTATFLANFQSLCYNAEINDIEEIKNIFQKSIIYDEFFNDEFLKKAKEINSMEELLKLFGDITADESILIKNDSCIAIKHAATGKYLNSASNLNYKTGTSQQAVFAGKTSLEQNALWIVKSSNQLNFVLYDGGIYLNHKMTDKLLICCSQYKSPLSNHTEVSCHPEYNRGNYNYTWKLKGYNSTNNCIYVKSQDRIILQISGNKILRSHELEFNLNDKSFQEVVCHDERIGGNDEWIIELIH
ncbi:hypothetical protein RhiirC2_745142 [Rhizophagus irregularis]|uniref:MIR domain-containing protein n=1 Tax=Rhizophagus irregularis TaxID=588596 RepID=A0A2N1NBA7_9GLOM|nr:hypothetical protein RhiirC2_745142 [Rhizophagus irregularis]